MTISWLTCTNNQGSLFLSLQEKRVTAQNLLRDFVKEEGRDKDKDGGGGVLLALSLACSGQESDLLACGKTSGDHKIQRLQWSEEKMVRPGWPSAEEMVE